MSSAVIMEDFRNAKKKQKKQMRRDAVAPGQSKSRRIKNIDGYFSSRVILMLMALPAEQGLSLTKKTAIGLWPCHRAHAVKASHKQPGAGADSPP